MTNISSFNKQAYTNEKYIMVMTAWPCFYAGSTSAVLLLRLARTQTGYIREICGCRSSE
jgi:hypothetical protein